MPEPAAPTDEALVAETLAGRTTPSRNSCAATSAASSAPPRVSPATPHQLDDICQEVFLRAFRNLAKFRRDAPFEHWLARITVSACYDFLRKERRVREQVSLDAARLSTCATPASDAAIDAGRARELIDFAMRRLSPDERLILTLCRTRRTLRPRNRRPHRMERKQREGPRLPRPPKPEKSPATQP